MLLINTKAPAVFELGTCRSLDRSYTQCATEVDTNICDILVNSVELDMLCHNVIKSESQGWQGPYL